MPATQGSVSALWRYPVKSMLGEALDAVEVTAQGLRGDRAYALVDGADGKAATAKNPKKRPTLFGYRAGFVAPPRADAGMPPVRITLPDGSSITSRDGDLDGVLTRALARPVTLRPAVPGQSLQSEEFKPDLDGHESRETVAAFTLREGTFFDCAMHSC
jgi:hypothetical protein